VPNCGKNCRFSTVKSWYKENFPGIYPTTFRIDLYSLTTSKPATVAVLHQRVDVVSILNNVVFQHHQDLLVQITPLPLLQSNRLDQGGFLIGFWNILNLYTHYLIKNCSFQWYLFHVIQSTAVIHLIFRPYFFIIFSSVPLLLPNKTIEMLVLALWWFWISNYFFE
jgi:hypothetical protein